MPVCLFPSPNPRGMYETLIHWPKTYNDISKQSSPRKDASLCPTEGAVLPASLPPGAHILEGHPSIQNLFFTHPTLSPWPPLRADQHWMLGEPMGAGPSPLMQDRALNPDNGMTPLFPSNPRAIHGNHHPAGVPLGMNMVQHR